MKWFDCSAVCALLFVTAGTLSACGGDDAQKKPDDVKAATPKTTEERDDNGKIIRRYDHNGDKRADVIKYLEEYADPDDPSITLTRMRKMELDLNSDGKINVVRYYNPAGKVESEQNDLNLDGKFDVVSYYDKGRLAKKDILDGPTGEVIETRYYTNNQLLRVERDTNKDKDRQIDYWEYYEAGVLDRIGRDFNDDGRADSWQKR